MIVSLIISVLIFYLSTMGPTEKDYEKIKIKKIIDGDTLEDDSGRRIRLANINSPEKNTLAYVNSLEFIKGYENSSVLIDNLGNDMYGRTLARIYAESGEYINLELVRKGFASKFLVQDDETELFSKAEREAINNFRGIWKKSVYYGCFYIKIDEKKEEVYFKNKCPTINVFSWFVKDESRKVYFFKNITLGEVYLISSKGIDDSKVVFWGSAQNVWNNDRDSLYFFDKEGGLVYYEDYGY